MRSPTVSLVISISLISEMISSGSVNGSKYTYNVKVEGTVKWINGQMDGYMSIQME